MINNVVIMGRLTKDVEERKTNSGKTVCGFCVALDDRFDKEKTHYVDVIAWNKTAEFICKYFGKGSAILVCGELQTRSWEDQQGNKRYATEVVAGEVCFCEAKRGNEGNNTTPTTNASQNGNTGAYGYNPYADAPNFEQVPVDDDLPFN
jgi:single-strand DNA-binding protein